MKFTTVASTLALSLAFSATIPAAELTIKVTNLTQGIYFTPIIIGAHTADASLFEVGEAASTELQMVAEGGDTSGIETVLTSISADILNNPAGGLLAPGMTAEGTLSTADTNTVMSLLTMLLPTNDGFVGVDNWAIPSEPGTYTVMVNGYDAGTEANDEIVNGGGAPGAPGIPADPTGQGGTGGSGVTSTEDNTTVHIHRGNLGDADLNGGASDLTNSVHRWLNPVARVVVTVE